jgi:hypothetical protein
MRQQVADLAQARGQTVSLAQAHSPLAWGAPVVSVLILAGFVWMLWLVVARPAVAANLSGELANVLLGTLAAMATQVANYWLGSSLGSAQKNQIVASAHAAALAVRAPEVPSADELNRRALGAARAG